MYDRLLDFPTLVKGGLVSPRWRHDGKSFVYVSDSGSERGWLEVDPASGKRRPLFDEGRLRAALTPALGHAPAGEGVPLREFLFVDGDSCVRFEMEERWFDLNLGDYAVRELSSAEITQLTRRRAKRTAHHHAGGAPDSYELPCLRGDFLLLRVEDHNLWIRDVVDNRSRPLTADGVDRFGWGLGPNWTPTPEIWSPDGSVLAAIKVDTRQVHHMPVVHWLGRGEEVEYHVYPPAGGILPRQELHFIDVTSGARIYVELGNDATYLRPVGWHPNGQEYLFAWLSRNGKRVEFRAADKRTGRTRCVWAEQAETFVAATMEFYLPGLPLFKMLADGRFIVGSERSGWNHLYLYGPPRGATDEPELLTRLTHGDYPVSKIVQVDERKGLVYLMAHCDPVRVYDTHLMSVGLDGKGLRQLTSATGEHQIQMAPANDYFLDTHSTIDRPPVTELRRSDGSLVTVLEEADISELTQLGWQAPEEFVVKAADGKTDLQGIIRRPWNFDPARKYPVIEYIYGGPQATVVPRNFTHPTENLGIFSGALAQLGYIVVSLDARGTPERGKAFQDVVYQNWGRHEIADHAAALRNAARTRPYMDIDRVGIFGHSYGGYYTIRALLQAPDLYKVGVALAPAAHLNSILALASENYFGGQPQEFPELYEYASNLPLVDRLQARFLIAHPTSDVNAPFAHAIQLIDALNNAGKRYDFNVMPEQDHSFKVSDSPREQELSRAAIRDYFLEHLPPVLR